MPRGAPRAGLNVSRGRHDRSALAFKRARRVPRSVLVEKEETGSTNDDARALAERGAEHGTAVLAARQTRGRGRAGRAFVSPEGGLYLSVVVRPDRPPSEWSLLPLVAGLAVVDELRAARVDASLKWPNDVLVAGRKLGGLLVESQWGREPFAIVGIGLNVVMSPVPGATSLVEAGLAVDRRVLAEAIVGRLVRVVEEWEARGASGLVARVREACVTLGRRVEWEKGEGVAIDIAEDGALVVDVGGEVRRVVAEDVRLRPS